jgi:hypothetical protein
MTDAAARNFQYLAYGLITAWLVLLAYVLTLVARERRLRAQIRNLEHMLEDREKK